MYVCMVCLFCMYVCYVCMFSMLCVYFLFYISVYAMSVCMYVYYATHQCDIMCQCYFMYVPMLCRCMCALCTYGWSGMLCYVSKVRMSAVFVRRLCMYVTCMRCVYVMCCFVSMCVKVCKLGFTCMRCLFVCMLVMLKYDCYVWMFCGSAVLCYDCVAYARYECMSGLYARA